MHRLILSALWLCVVTLTRASQPGLPPDVKDTQNPQDKPLPPAEALRKLTLPEGFQATLFAGEPGVLQPVAFTFDDRGRLWVIECFSYPKWDTARDRIVIFTDRDGDGRFDDRKVFYEKGQRFFGIETGFGGVWITAAPNLLFIPDKDGDDVPDGEPQVVLEGFTLVAGHNSVNGLSWGPDGWLYGRHGITAPSLVGRPGTPEEKCVRLNCSIWRYHPVKQVIEVVTHGTTNPWGLDWDDHGHAFFSNNVIGHLWHVVPGAHYQRMHGQDYNPYSYELLASCSDHLHWAAAKWQDARTGQEAYGGGHSHAGAMIYLGDNWPDRYRQSLFMCNTHGNRVLFDQLERRGSGYTGRHGDNFLLANDKWFRGVTISYGPDGGVFVSDWNDLGECHDQDGSYRSSGRIYKITYGAMKPAGDLDLARLTDAELVNLQLHRNDWHVRHARRLLQERAVSGRLAPGTHAALQKILATNPEVTRQLRALWALRVTGGLPEAQLVKLLGHESEYVRWWAVQFLCEGDGALPVKVPAAVLKQFVAMARQDRSPMVRLALASVLQRLPLADRWDIVFALADHAEDATDQNLPLMLWYAAEPLVTADRSRAVQLLARCKIPQVREFVARRMAGN